METTLDRLAGDWWIHQLRRGHRYSTDDLLLAWTGVRERPEARTVLDLGAGTGSVGLLALQLLPEDARLVQVELQAESVEVARRTVAENHLGCRVEVRHGDLRDEAVCADLGRFDLVLANPPYLLPGAATPSPVAHRRNARLELHGDVGDFTRVAAAHLAPGGCFCLSHAAADPRPARALADSGLCLLSRQEAVFRAGASPTVALYAAAWEGDRRDRPLLVIRGADGRRTEDWISIRRALRIDP